MVDSFCRFSRSNVPSCIFLVLVVLTSKVTSVAAVVELYVTPTSTFTGDMNAQLAGASADNYVVHLSAGLYTGCGPETIELRPGSALSVTVIGAGEEETTIDCENVVLTSPVFTCGENCTAVLQNLMFTRGKMTTASPDGVGALVSVLDGASVTLQGVNVNACWTVTNGDALSFDLTDASSIVRVSGSGTRLLVADSTFSNNTGEIGSISAIDDGQVSVSGSHFEFNKGGGGDPGQGFGGVLSFASGAVGNVSQSSFVSNSASDKGGVAYSGGGGGDVTFVNVVIQDSSALFHGGVVCTYDGGNVSFIDVTIQDSSAGTEGGVAYSNFGGDVSFVHVTSQNSHGYLYGGVACSYNGGDVSFVDMAIQDSTAGLEGGVVYSYNSGDVSFADVTTQNCSSGSYGGVVSSQGGGDVSFVGVTTQNSSVSLYGGVVFSKNGGDVSFVEVTTQDSSADSEGGVVYSYNSGDVSFTDVVAQDSSAVYYGGVVYSEDGGDVSFVYVTTQDSSVDFNGGVVFLKNSGDVSFVEVTTQGSSAGNAGGVVYSVFGTGDLSFVDVVTRDSNAGSFGGVVFAADRGDLSFVRVTTQDSVSGDSGGVVCSALGGSVSFVDVTTQHSSALYHGGVVYSANDDGDVSLFNVTTRDSSAGVDGGVVHSENSGGVSLINVATYVSSAGYGGVLYAQGSGDVSFVEVTTQDSSAGSDGAIMVLQPSTGTNVSVTMFVSGFLEGDSALQFVNNDDFASFFMNVTVLCLSIPLVDCEGGSCVNAVSNGSFFTIGCAWNDVPICSPGTLGDFCGEVVEECSENCGAPPTSSSTSLTYSSFSSSLTTSSSSTSSSSTSPSSSFEGVSRGSILTAPGLASVLLLVPVFV